MVSLLAIAGSGFGTELGEAVCEGFLPVGDEGCCTIRGLGSKKGRLWLAGVIVIELTLLVR